MSYTYFVCSAIGMAEQGVRPRLIEIVDARYFPEKGEKALMDWRRSNITPLTGNRPLFLREMDSTNLIRFFQTAYQ